MRWWPGCRGKSLVSLGPIRALLGWADHGTQLHRDIDSKMKRPDTGTGLVLSRGEISPALRPKLKLVFSWAYEAGMTICVAFGATSLWTRLGGFS